MLDMVIVALLPFEDTRYTKSSRQHNMSSSPGGDVFGRAIAEGAKVDAGEQRFALTKYNWSYSQVNLVDMTAANKLPHGRDSAADLDILAARGVTRALQGYVNAVGHEVEGRAAFHFQ